MQLINIKAKRIENKGRYNISLATNNGLVITLKFDSGAANTVISLDSLFGGEISEEDKERFQNYIKTNGYPSHNFTSAIGDCMVGYLTCFENVYMDEYLIDKFYFYLIIDNKRTIALLGDDFIDNCEYSHKIHDDVIITQFDSEAYCKQYVGAIKENEIISLLDSCS